MSKRTDTRGVAEAWARGEAAVSNGALHTDGVALQSYWTVIGVRRDDVALVTAQWYSRTTSRHVSYARCAAAMNHLPVREVCEDALREALA